MASPPRTQTLSDREIQVSHVIEAPAAKVFAAYTDPKQVPKWWGASGATMTVEAMEVRPGGAWRFRQRMADGRDLISFGNYLEVKPVTCLVYTFQMEGQPNVVTTTVDLHEADGHTTVTLTLRAESKDLRDLMMKHGAEGGARAALQQLASYLRTV